MAQYGRVRSGISIFSKLGLLSSQRSNLQRSVIAPSITLASRSYAHVPGQREDKVKVPIAMFGGSENYASALYIAAVKANAVEKVDFVLLQFVEAVKGSKLTSQFLNDISIAKDVRVKVVQDISAADTVLKMILKPILPVISLLKKEREKAKFPETFMELSTQHGNATTRGTIFSEQQ